MQGFFYLEAVPSIGNYNIYGYTKKMSKHIQLTTKHIDDVCSSWPVSVAQEAKAPLVEYLMLLMRWNKVMNLVGARHWQECLTNLIIDSFYLSDFLRSLALPTSESFQTLDLGAGAGLPGIPLRMAWQDGEYHLIEVREKRALFLGNVLAQIPLPRTHVFRGRVEEFFAKAQKPADMIVSRAFMPWAQMLELVAPALAVDGRVIFLTLEPAPQAALQELGWQVEAEFSYTVHGDKRFFWSVKKA